MEQWDDESAAEREAVPLWLVEFSRLWAAQSATQYKQEFAEWRRLARAANVPPFIVVLRLFRDTYGVTPATTREAFKAATARQMQANGGQMFLQAKPPQS